MPAFWQPSFMIEEPVSRYSHGPARYPLKSFAVQDLLPAQELWHQLRHLADSRRLGRHTKAIRGLSIATRQALPRTVKLEPEAEEYGLDDFE